MPYVKGDPHWIRVNKYDAARPCAGCGAKLERGDRAWFWPRGRRIECEECGETSERRFEAECALETW